MRWLARFLGSTLVVLAVSGHAHALTGVRVLIANGRVSIAAQDVTVAEILDEWAKVGQTKLDHLERLPSDRVTILLENVSEQEALGVLLRHAGGYIASRRAGADPTASVFERILIAPIVVPPAPVVAQAAPAGAGAVAGSGAAAAVDAQPQVAAPPQSSEQTANDVPPPSEEPTPVPEVAVPMTDAQTQAAFKERRALETADARKFNFPKPQVVIQTVTPPRRPGGQ